MTVNTTNWPAEAARAAMYAAEKHASDHHGAIHWGDSKIAAVFGNDGYCDNDASQVVVGLVREQLREAGIRVLAFGLDDSGNTWTLLVESNDLEDLHAVASAAWKVASESNPDDLEWHYSRDSGPFATRVRRKACCRV
jgi:hypothetical protein